MIKQKQAVEAVKQSVLEKIGLAQPSAFPVGGTSIAASLASSNPLPAQPSLTSFQQEQQINSYLQQQAFQAEMAKNQALLQYKQADTRQYTPQESTEEMEKLFNFLPQVEAAQAAIDKEFERAAKEEARKELETEQGGKRKRTGSEVDAFDTSAPGYSSSAASVLASGVELVPPTPPVMPVPPPFLNRVSPTLIVELSIRLQQYGTIDIPTQKEEKKEPEESKKEGENDTISADELAMLEDYVNAAPHKVVPKPLT